MSLKTAQVASVSDVGLGTNVFIWLSYKVLPFIIDCKLIAKQGGVALVVVV